MLISEARLFIPDQVPAPKDGVRDSGAADAHAGHALREVPRGDGPGTGGADHHPRGSTLLWLSESHEDLDSSMGAEVGRN